MQAGASGRAVTALVLAIVSWVLCGFLTAIPAIFVAKAELGAIERGESSVAGKGMAQAAFWIAIINTVCTCIVVMIYAIVIGIGISSGGFQGF